MVSHTQCNARTIEEIVHDYKGRRAGLIKALTTDVEKFCNQFGPEKDSLWLYGYPTEEWEVCLPEGDVPPMLPEPVPGLNFARHGMDEKVWLSLVAGHCDAWLIRVAFFMGSKYGFNKSDRDQLFNKINELPTIFEVVTGAAKKQLHMRAPKPQVKQTKAPEPKYEVEELEEDDDDEHVLCGACGVHHGHDYFWICCDICDIWFHGECVMVTPAMAEYIKQYKCPSCTNNKSALP